VASGGLGAWKRGRGSTMGGQASKAAVDGIAHARAEERTCRGLWIMGYGLGVGGWDYGLWVGGWDYGLWVGV
jgi:hypothetical protein